MTHPAASRIVVVAGRAALPEMTWCLETDEGMNAASPVVRVSRAGGTTPAPGLDDARLDIDVFATGLDATEAAAAAVRSWLVDDLPGQIVTVAEGAAGTGQICAGRDVSSERDAPTTNPALRRLWLTARVVVQAVAT